MQKRTASVLLTRQAASVLMVVSISAMMFGVFGILKGSQNDSGDVIDGSLTSFVGAAAGAEVLGSTQAPPASLADVAATGDNLPPEGEVATQIVPDRPPEGLPDQPVAPAENGAPSTTVARTTTTTTPPLLSAADTLSARPEDFQFTGGPKPVALRISQVGIEANVVNMGLTDDRRLEAPPAEQIGWYEHGPTPGTHGSSVLAAHVDWGGQPGAFFELRDVTPGDRIEIDFDDGSTQAFEIVASRQYNKDDVPKKQIFDRTGAPRLVLVTCGGAFDNSIGHYEDNFVAFAKPVS